MLNPIIDHFSPEMMTAYSNYLANPNNTTFFSLTQILQESPYADITGIVYALDFAKSKNASSLRRLICALFLESRFIEIVYYYEKYKSYFTQNKEVTRIYTLSRILAGLLDSEDNMIENYKALNDDRHHILTIILAYLLRAGDLKQAHSIAKELSICPDCLEPGFVAIIETAVRVPDIDLLRNTLIEARRNSIELDFGTFRTQKIERFLLKSLLRIIKKYREDKK